MDPKTKIGIYSLKGIVGESSVTIVPHGIVELLPNENIRDTCINRFEIFNNVSGLVFACNITQYYLMSSKKQPVIYVSIVYERGLKCYRLMDIYVNFTITSEIKSERQLLNSKVVGNFEVEAVINGETVKLDEKIEEFPGEQELVDKLSKFITSDGMKDMIHELLETELDKQREKFKEQMNGLKIPEKTISLKKFEKDH